MKGRKIVVRQPLLNLSNLRLNHGMRFQLGFCGTSLIVELFSGSSIIMAFLFQHFPMQKIKEKQRLLAIQHCPSRDYPLDDVDVDKLVPIRKLDKLPDYPYWKINSSMGEDLFWCNRDLWLELVPFGTGSSVMLYGYNHGQIGSMRYPGMGSDSDFVLSSAKELRNRFHIDRQIRVESLYEGQRITWYAPPKARAFP